MPLILALSHYAFSLSFIRNRFMESRYVTHTVSVHPLCISMCCLISSDWIKYWGHSLHIYSFSFICINILLFETTRLNEGLGTLLTVLRFFPSVYLHLRRSVLCVRLILLLMICHSQCRSEASGVLLDWWWLWIIYNSQSRSEVSVQCGSSDDYLNW